MTIASDDPLMRRLMWRLGLFLGVSYLMAGIDRFNVSIAALSMNDELGLSARAFGAGIAAFFWTYILFQVPSNMVLARIGARLWLACIMISWGVTSSGMMLIYDETSFILSRLLLGLTEAGFYPGVLFLATQWIPESHRARFIGHVNAWGVASTIVGPPIAASLMQLDGTLGMAGWRWLFLIEGLPAVLLGVAALRVLADRPARATWLSAAEREELEVRLQKDRESVVPQHASIAGAMSSRLGILMIIWFSIEVGAFTLAYWMPLVIKEMGLSTLQIGYIAAVPGLCGCISMLLWSRRSDLTGERHRHLMVAMVVGGGSLVLTGFLLHRPLLSMAAMCLAMMGIVSSIPLVWTFPQRFIASRNLALGLAFVNCAGTAAGLVSSYLVGRLKDATGDYTLALLVTGAPMVACALLVALLRTGREQPRAGQLDAEVASR